PLLDCGSSARAATPRRARPDRGPQPGSSTDHRRPERRPARQPSLLHHQPADNGRSNDDLTSNEPEGVGLSSAPSAIGQPRETYLLAWASVLPPEPRSPQRRLGPTPWPTLPASR